MNNKVGLSIHLVSNLIQLMGGKFKEIERKDSGEVFIMFTLPFEKREETKYNRVRKTDIKLNAERSYENGSHILKSPEINSKGMLVKINIEKSLNNIQRTSSKNTNIIQNEKSIDKARCSMKHMVSLNAEDLESKSIIDKTPSEKEIIDVVQVNDNHDRNDLNSTIVPGKSKFPIKYTPKKQQPAKNDARRNQDAPSFPNENLGIF